MSNNFLLNNCQNLLMMLVLLLFQGIIYGLYARSRRSEGDWVARNSKSRKLMVFLLNRIHVTFESSFLLISLSILLQFQSVNFESALNGFSFLFSLVFMGFAVWEIYSAYRRINRQGASRSDYKDLYNYYGQML